MSDEASDAVARRIFQKALDDNCAGDVLRHLFEGDAVTIDSRTGEFVFIPVSALAQLVKPSDEKGTTNDRRPNPQLHRDSRSGR